MNIINLDEIKLKRFIIIFVLLSLFVTPVFGYTLSKTAPYAEIPEQGEPNWYSMDLEFIQAGHNDRIRQTGTITQIRFAVVNSSALTEFNFTIWRQNGSNYDRVATTDNLINNISNGINVINLNPPLEGIQEGDFYGYRMKPVFPRNALYVDMNDTNHLTYFTNDPLSYIDYNWTSQGSSNKIFVIETYMFNPYMVFIGDSIISGHNFGLHPDEHFSFIENLNGITNIPASIENQWSKKLNDRTYQNMGHGGDNTFQIKNRYYKDVINLSPDFVLIEGGINDLNSSVSNTEILTNWKFFIETAYNNNITPVIMLILPSNKNGTDEIVSNISYLNEQLMLLATKYTPSIVVDARCYVGVYRPSGPAGNCWNTNASYTIDNGKHFNRFGNERIAQAIKDSFRYVYGKQGLYNLIQSDGTIIYSSNLINAVNTSWRMASSSGSANVSYNIPSSRELANMTVNSGIIEWFSINDLTSNSVCSLYLNGVQIESKKAANNSVNFTTALTPGTYTVILESSRPAATIQTGKKPSDFITNSSLIIGMFFLMGLIIEMYLLVKKKRKLVSEQS